MANKFWKSAVPIIGGLLDKGLSGGLLSALASKIFGKKKPVTNDEMKTLIMNSSPEQFAELQKFEKQNETELQKLLIQKEISLEKELTGRMVTVNETMQSEAKSEHWAQWAWRPFWGFASGLAFFVVCMFFCIMMYKSILGGHPEMATHFGSMVSAFAQLFGMAAVIVGASAWHRGVQKRIAIGDNVKSTPINTIKSLVGKSDE